MTNGLTRDNTLLFRATYLGIPVSIGHATDAELDAIATPIDLASTRDALRAWSLVAVRDPDGHVTQVHALGWRVALVNTWITSPLVGADLQAQAVSTKSGHTYRLELQGGPELAPALRDHLAFALRTWGFANVGP